VEWLRDRYLVQGARIRDIAAEVGSRELAVHHALVRAKIPLRGVPRIYPQLCDQYWLRLRYVEHRISVRDIADELGCDRSTVIAALAAAGIPRPRPTRRRPRRFAELADHDWPRRRYLDEGASQRELAVEIGCSIRAVRTALAEAQVTPRPQGRWVKRSSTQVRAWIRSSGSRLFEHCPQSVRRACRQLDGRRRHESAPVAPFRRGSLRRLEATVTAVVSPSVARKPARPDSARNDPRAHYEPTRSSWSTLVI
jgi:hypothetical protein